MLKNLYQFEIQLFWIILWSYCYEVSIIFTIWFACFFSLDLCDLLQDKMGRMIKLLSTSPSTLRTSTNLRFNYFVFGVLMIYLDFNLSFLLSLKLKDDWVRFFSFLPMLCSSHSLVLSREKAINHTTEAGERRKETVQQS